MINKELALTGELTLEIGAKAGKPMLLSVKRLEARPTATQCIDCKTLDELRGRVDDAVPEAAR